MNTGNIPNYGNISGIVIFELNGTEFCTDLDDIISIIKIDDSVKFLKTKNKLYLDLNFALIPVINFRKFIKPNKRKKNEDNRLIVVESAGKQFAFIADKINEIYIIKNENLINSMEKTDSDIFENIYIKGKINHDGKDIFIPDYLKIFNDINFNSAKTVQAAQT